MANNSNLKEPWKPGQSGNPKGRPRNRVIREWLPACFGKGRTRLMTGLSADEISTIERILLVATTEELKTFAGWTDAPAYAKNLAMAILYDTKNGRTTTIDKLRERQYGKAVQKVELTGADGAPLVQTFPAMTMEEAREFLRRLDTDC